MKVSVAIPTVGRDTLHATLRSLARQTVLPHEVLVVNQGSPDLEAALKYDLPIRHLHQDARGLSRARNRAIDTYSGDWILFTDDDQEVSPDWVEQLGVLAGAFPQADLFGGAVLPPVKYDPSKEFVSQLYVPGEIVIDRESYLRPPEGPFMGNDIWGGNFALSRRCVEKIGRYDEYLGRGSGLCEVGEDTDYTMRAISQGLTGVLSCRLIIYHTYGVRPIMESTTRELIEMAAVIEWKSAHDPDHLSPELASRVQPFGKKKALLSRWSGGAVFKDHGWRKSVFDEFKLRLDAGYQVEAGRILPKQQ